MESGSAQSQTRSSTISTSFTRDIVIVQVSTNELTSCPPLRVGSALEVFVTIFFLNFRQDIAFLSSISYHQPYLVAGATCKSNKTLCLDYHLYAYDSQLHFAFKSIDVGATKLRVENCISAICRWVDLNEFKLNHIKTEAMLIQSKYHPSPSFQS